MSKEYGETSLAKLIRGELQTTSILDEFAKNSSSDINDVIRNLASLPLNVPSNGSVKLCLPGHFLEDPQLGPYRHGRVMIIGKHPGEDEEARQRLFIGPSGQLLRKGLKEFDIPFQQCYVTNVLRYRGKFTLANVRAFLPVLQYEIQNVNPSIIWILGNDAIRALLGSKLQSSLYRNQVLEIEGKKVICGIHPAAVEHNVSALDDWRISLRVFSEVINGTYEEIEPEYVVLDDLQKAKEFLSELATLKPKRIYLDCEWYGRNHTSGLLRTIQLSLDSSMSYIFSSWSVGDKIKFNYWFRDLRDEFKALLDTGVEIVGHNFKADLHFLNKFLDLDVARYFYENGHDTMLMHHVYRSHLPHGLKDIAAAYGAQKYEFDLQFWLKFNSEKHLELFSNFLKANNIPFVELDPQIVGYGHVPDKILYPYSAMDTIVTARIFEDLNQKLQSDPSQWELYRTYEFMANEGLFEAEERGIFVDGLELSQLTEEFYVKRKELHLELDGLVREKISPVIDLTAISDEAEYKKLCKEFKDSDDENAKKVLKIFKGATIAGDAFVVFNPASPKQVQFILYDQLGYNLEPTLYTDESLKNALAEDNSESYAGASTSLTSLKLLLAKYPEHEFIRKLIDYRIVSKVSSSVLAIRKDYSKGSLYSHIDSDGRIRTTFLQITSTGRYNSSRPNMQNNPKKREEDYRRIFGKDVILRSIFRATDGYRLVEADFKQAELRVLGWIAKDDKFLQDLASDLHSIRAKQMFNLDCPVEEVKEKYTAQRIIAKGVNFSIPYGTTAQGLVVNLMSETGQTITEYEAQRFIDDFFNAYPNIRLYQEQKKREALTNGFVETPFHRRRYFNPDVESESQIGREAANHPIQGTVADALNGAIMNYVAYKKLYIEDPTDIYLLLCIHDALIFEVKEEKVDQYCSLIKELMGSSNVIPNLRKALDVDIEVFVHWGKD